jgi:integrase
MTTPQLTDNSTDIGREGVYLHKGSKQFVSRLGFELNPAGNRVRAFQYLGHDPEQATVKHVRIVALWKWTKSTWPSIRDIIRSGLPITYRETADLTLPVWVRDEWWSAAIHSEKTALMNEMRHAVASVTAFMEGGKRIAKYLTDQQDDLALLPDADRAVVFQAIAPPAHEMLGYSANAKRVTVEQASKFYVADMRLRIDLPEEGIKASTFQNAARMLRLGLDLRKADEPEQKVLDPNAMLESLSRDDLIAFKRAWLAKVSSGKIAKRTAANYCKAVQFFLAWCYTREGIFSRKVADLDTVFRFTDVNPINIADFATVKDDLKAILAAAPDRIKLYVYLALNCGAYQVDIGNLKLSEIQTRGKDHFIVHRRNKTSHQNDFASQHWLWPESWHLLSRYLAPSDPTKNPDGLALLNESGQPLYRGSADHAKLDNITSAYWRVVQGINAERAIEKLSPISLPFKQFRKLGATAMNNIGDETVQKLYRAASFDGSDRFYVRGDFTVLTAALKEWRKQLKAEEVL